ncbi:hypothetical protein [Flavobacterium sp.]|uniref:hypothetical protein n=1 Tax=Flavobacterium sp. TaxID=239 RepID=UPI003D6A4932
MEMEAGWYFHGGYKQSGSASCSTSITQLFDTISIAKEEEEHVFFHSSSATYLLLYIPNVNN